MTQKKEAETVPIATAKPAIAKPIRARQTKVTKPSEPVEVIAPVTEPAIEEITTETIEFSAISLDQDNAISDKKDSKKKAKKKLKMKEKDKKKAKKAAAKQKAKVKAKKAKKAKKDKAKKAKVKAKIKAKKAKAKSKKAKKAKKNKK
ncbi:hypothetical protein [Flavobacterium sp. ZS1P14]|uniref:hypothetical protein n=1 Tax=Flavobacterium sp. ZS1P14 TaxID=3401729 RepID=UPI003AB06F22